MVNWNIWGQIKSKFHTFLGYKLCLKLFFNKSSLTWSISIIKTNYMSMRNWSQEPIIGIFLWNPKKKNTRSFCSLCCKAQLTLLCRILSRYDSAQPGFHASRFCSWQPTGPKTRPTRLGTNYLNMPWLWTLFFRCGMLYM